MEGLTFGQASELAKTGKFIIFRKGWNGKRMYVFYQGEVIVSAQDIVDAKETISPAFRAGVLKNFAFTENEKIKAKDVPIRLRGHFCLKAADDSVMIGWMPNQMDLTENDWGAQQVEEN